jgi:hypothetical protein
MPMTIDEATSQQDFYRLPRDEQAKVLGSIEPDFNGLAPIEQNKVLGKYHLKFMQGQKAPTGDSGDSVPGVGGQIMEGLEGLGGAVIGAVEGIPTQLRQMAVMADYAAPPEEKMRVVHEVMDQPTEEGKKAIAAFQQGKYLSAGKHAIGAVPVFGAPAEDIIDDARSGHAGRAIGKTLGLAAPIVLREEIGAGASKAGGVAADAGKAFFKKDFEVASSKAWGFTPSQEEMGAQSEDAAAYIKETNGGKRITTNKEHIAAAQKANKRLTDLYDSWMQSAKKRGAVIDGNQVLKATWDALPDTVKSGEPAKAKVVMQRARRLFADKKLTPEQADQYRRELTSDLKGFYDATTGKQLSVMNGTSYQSVVLAQRDALANGLYEALDPVNGGTGPRNIRQMQKSVIDLLDAGRKRTTMAAASKPVSKAAAAPGIAVNAVKSVAAPGFGIMRGADLLNPRTLFAGSVDPWVRKAYEAAGKPKATLSGPPSFTPRALLGKASVITPPPADTSGPVPGRTQPEWTQPQSKRLLGPARGKLVTPPSGQPIVTEPPPGSYPVSGPLPRQYPRGSGVNRLLGEPTQVQQPGFAVQDMHPITDPVTGKITHVTEDWKRGQIPASEALKKHSQDFNAKPGSKITTPQFRAMESLRSGGPVDLGPRGPVYHAYRGKPAEAISFLQRAKKGTVPGAFYNPEVGEIDLPWGNREAGLRHIIDKHVRGQKDLKLADLPEQMANMKVLKRETDRVLLGSSTHRGVVRLDFNAETNRWLLTAFEK